MQMIRILQMVLILPMILNPTMQKHRSDGRKIFRPIHIPPDTVPDFQTLLHLLWRWYVGVLRLYNDAMLWSAPFPVPSSSDERTRADERRARQDERTEPAGGDHDRPETTADAKQLWQRHFSAIVKPLKEVVANVECPLEWDDMDSSPGRGHRRAPGERKLWGRDPPDPSAGEADFFGTSTAEVGTTAEALVANDRASKQGNGRFLY